MCVFFKFKTTYVQFFTIKHYHFIITFININKKTLHYIMFHITKTVIRTTFTLNSHFWSDCVKNPEAWLLVVGLHDKFISPMTIFGLPPSAVVTGQNSNISSQQLKWNWKKKHLVYSNRSVIISLLITKLIILIHLNHKRTARLTRSWSLGHLPAAL